MRWYVLVLFVVAGVGLLGPQFAAADVLYEQTFDTATSETNPWGMMTDYPELFDGVDSNGGTVVVDSTGAHAHQVAVTAKWGVVRAFSSVILGESSWPTPLSASADVGQSGEGSLLWFSLNDNLFFQVYPGAEAEWALYTAGGGFVKHASGTKTWSDGEMVHASIGLVPTGSTFDCVYSLDGNSGVIHGLTAAQVGAGSIAYVGLHQYGTSMGATSAGTVYMDNLVISDTVSIPEPTSCLILLSGVIGLLAYAWRRRK